MGPSTERIYSKMACGSVVYTCGPWVLCFPCVAEPEHVNSLCFTEEVSELIPVPLWLDMLWKCPPLLRVINTWIDIGVSWLVTTRPVLAYKEEEGY